MPYMIVQQDDKHCIFKQGEDEQPEGETLGCHDSEEEAQKQIAAIEAEEGQKALPDMEGMSVNELNRIVCDAFHSLLGEDGYVMDVYENYGIISLNTGEYFRAGYTMSDGTPVPAPREEWLAVKQEWVEAKGLDTLVAYGNAVKALGDGRVGGYLVLFGDPDNADLEGEFFAPDTDFDIGAGAKSSIYYHHGWDPKLKRRKIGEGQLRVDDVGVWIEGQLYRRDRYEEAVYELAQKGKLGWSSATARHLIDKEPVGKAWKIKRWPLGLDASLTPVPIDPRSHVIGLKSLMAANIPDLQVQPEASSDAARTAGNGIAADEKKTRVEITNMAEPQNDQTPPAGDGDAIKSLNTRMDALDENLNRLLKYMEDSPALKSAGYYTDDGGRADPAVKSFGDFALAIMRHDDVRLTEVYKAVKDLGEDAGGAGGYLVPSEYRTAILQIAAKDSPILSRVQTIPVNTPSGEWPMLDHFAAPTAGSGASAEAAGMTAGVIAENATITKTEPSFEMLKWRVNAVKRIIPVSNELNMDSPIAIETMLRTLCGIVVRNLRERNVLRGSGAGEMLGILNAPVTIAVTSAAANVFAYVDALTAISRFKSVTGGAPVWIIHPSYWPDIGKFEVSAGSGGVIQANLGALLTKDILGWEIVPTEHLPQADNGGVILADLGSYVLFERGGLSIAFSEHAGFKEDQGIWRLVDRADGMPWMKNAITLADPQGSYTVSPFVQVAD